MFSFFADNPVAAVIVLCEVGLWILLGAGLVLRYLARLRLAGAVVLAGIPLLDVVLLVAAAVDLHRGAEPDAIHGLAGIYLGVSVAFGPSIVRWADVRFAHRFAGGPAPVKHPKGSPERVAALWREWNRVVLAAVVASAALLGLAFVFAEPAHRDPLVWWAGRAWLVVGIWLLAGPVWEGGTRSSGASRDEDRVRR
ncbi:hypothetical protein [Nocardioides sp. SYSU D00065]|uniref:hypothetical protein n=1 Tax=Nocardioides sp. SYSU D00065 TaxID=2817378 RepID=UPI001B33D763|nr:hypothetical protein [Nocardioides sp. SYSU D00065]